MIDNETLCYVYGSVMDFRFKEFNILERNQEHRIQMCRMKHIYYATDTSSDYIRRLDNGKMVGRHV